MTRDGTRDGSQGLRLGGVLLAAALLGAACGGANEEPRLPTEAELQEAYGGMGEVRLNGNVVDVRVGQAFRHLERGGGLWAKFGPYVFLFSPQTRDLFRDYPGVAAVRVRTVTPGGDVIAEAMLRRDELNELTWEEAIRRAGRARTEGTQKPGLVEDLISYGEEHTSYEYNPAYVGGS